MIDTSKIKKKNKAFLKSRETETLFQIDPDEEPQLIDEYFGENYQNLLKESNGLVRG